MFRLVISLLLSSIVALVNADYYEDGHHSSSSSSSSSFAREELEDLYLSEIDQGRSELQICGNNNSCESGLECVRVGASIYKRCIPRRDCLARELNDFQTSFDIEGYKKLILDKAGVTEQEVIQSTYDVHDRDSVMQNKAIQAVVEAMQENYEVFRKAGDIANKCSLPTSSSTDMGERRIQNTEPDSTDTEPDFEPSPRPTPAPKSTPAPTPHPTSTWYIGIQFEAGLGFDGTITILWEMGRQDPPQYIKYCLGVGLQAGAAINLIYVIADTQEGEKIDCLSAMYDIDLTIGIGAGYALGVCLLTEPPFLFQELTLGMGGLGFSASGFSMCSRL